MTKAVIQRVIDLGPCEVCGLVHDRCKGHKQHSIERGDPKPCGYMAAPGQLVCRKAHGGAAPQNIRAAERRQARERAQGEVGALLAQALGEIEPMSGPEQMMMGINHAGAMALSYRWLLDELPVRSLWSWSEHENDKGDRTRWVVTKPAPDGEGLIGPDHQGAQKLHAYEEGFRFWTRLHGQLLKAAADIGLEERRQRFQEDQVRTIGSAIRGIVEGLGRDLDDPTVVPVVEQALKTITATSAA